MWLSEARCCSIDSHEYNQHVMIHAQVWPHLIKRFIRGLRLSDTILLSVSSAWEPRHERKGRPQLRERPNVGGCMKTERSVTADVVKEGDASDAKKESDKRDKGEGETDGY